MQEVAAYLSSITWGAGGADGSTIVGWGSDTVGALGSGLG